MLQWEWGMTDINGLLFYVNYVDYKDYMNIFRNYFNIRNSRKYALTHYVIFTLMPGNESSILH